jgi:hypothetical protein
MTERNVIFISHANPEDNVFTTWLGSKLTASGYEVWADVLRLVGGQDWQRKLEDALRNRAFKVLLVGTQRGVDKQGVRNEIQIASTKAKELGDNEFIIPLKLEHYDSPFNIVHAQYIDFSKSWAHGLAELLETLTSYAVPKTANESPELWRAVQLIAGKAPVCKEETLISNWIKFISLPEEINFYDFSAGISIGRKDMALENSSIPLVPKNRGFISFSDLDSLQGVLGSELPIKLIQSYKTEDFLISGWPDLKIDLKDARNQVSNMLRQGIEAALAAKGLSAHEMANRKLTWYGKKNAIPAGQIRFNWNNEIEGRRVIIGHSEKRKIYWHFGVSPQISMWPEPHIKLRGRLVFSEDGGDPINDVKKMHRLRRSFAKSWRNARWRDMLLAMLWWLTDGKDSFSISFGTEKAVLLIPFITFTSPVSMPVDIEVTDPDDQDDPDEETDPLTADDLDVDEENDGADQAA